MNDITITQKDIAWAKWNLIQANDVPEQQTIVNRRWRELQDSMKDKYPRPKSKAGQLVAQLTKERKRLEMLISHRGDLKEQWLEELAAVNAKIKAFVIEPKEADVERKRQAYDQAVAKLYQMKQYPK